MASLRPPEPEALSDQGLFQQAMRHAAIGMALVSAEGRFLEVNTSLCRMLGRDEADLSGLLLQDITHPDDRSESLELIEEIVHGGQEAFQRQLRYLHADSRLIWAQVSVSCLRRGADCLLIVQIVDISEAIRQRQALADREHQYRLLAESARGVIWTMRPDGTISYVSPSI